jgi:carboxypeptidase D
MGGGNSSTGLDGFHTRRTNRDVEAGDFDENQLDDLHAISPRAMDRDHYSVGEASDDESIPEKGDASMKRTRGS